MTVDDMLELARQRLVRVGPLEAAAEHRAGAALVDIRPEAQRHLEGQIPGALVIERNVLEWRFDPASDWHIPEVLGYDTRVIVICSEGYTSSLAAASLQDLGLHRATDLEGGYWAWFDAGLPVVTSATVRTPKSGPTSVRETNSLDQSTTGRLVDKPATDPDPDWSTAGPASDETAVRF